MGTNLHDVYYCQMNRNQELNNRIYSRNIPSRQMDSSYFARPVNTYGTIMPFIDNHKKSSVKKATFANYDVGKIFNPGQSAPYNGYSKNVDIESSLHNSFFPAQNCGQNKHIPGTNSDMFHNNYLTKTDKSVKMTNKLLFKQERFNSFNPNSCNLGYKMFNNFTDQQIKDVKY
jgi:hypothetical protein